MCWQELKCDGYILIRDELLIVIISSVTCFITYYAQHCILTSTRAKDIVWTILQVGSIRMAHSLNFSLNVLWSKACLFAEIMDSNLLLPNEFSFHSLVLMNIGGCFIFSQISGPYSSVLSCEPTLRVTLESSVFLCHWRQSEWCTLWNNFPREVFLALLWWSLGIQWRW